MAKNSFLAEVTFKDYIYRSYYLLVEVTIKVTPAALKCQASFWQCWPQYQP